MTETTAIGTTRFATVTTGAPTTDTTAATAARTAYRNNYRAGFRQGYEDGYRDGAAAAFRSTDSGVAAYYPPPAF